MAIRMHPEPVTAEPQEGQSSSDREAAFPWREAGEQDRPRAWGEGRPSLAGRPHPDHPDRQVGPAGRVLVIGLTCFLVWGLLAAPSLRRSAESAPLGVRRTAALAVL